ncbi:MAG: hypothetical protein AB7D51_04465, partial [Desulfovibrionaceae bacterium]
MSIHKEVKNARCAASNHAKNRSDMGYWPFSLVVALVMIADSETRTHDLLRNSKQITIAHDLFR